MGPVAFSGRTDVESIAATIANELSTRDWGWRRSVRGLLDHLVSILVRRLDRTGQRKPETFESPAVDADPRTAKVVHTVMEYCAANYRTRASLSAVAAEVAATGAAQGAMHHWLSHRNGLCAKQHSKRRVVLRRADPPTTVS